jgi:O-antigen/teichoic acid export membrane protein
MGLPRALALSPALAATAIRGLGGVGFALGNLLLARALPAEAFALTALGLAFLNLAIPLGPLGADGVVNRRQLDPAPRLLLRCLLTTALVASICAALLAWLYAADAELIALVALGALGGGPASLAGAYLQGQRRFAPALLLSELGNWTLMLAGAFALGAGVATSRFPLAIVALGQLIAAAAAWGLLLRRRSGLAAGERYPWLEGLSLAGMGAAVLVLLQLERLLLPGLLGLDALAVFGVLASVALAPFRMLQNGVTFTLLPRLRHARPERRARLLVREGLMVGAVATGASLLAVALGPWIVELLAGPRYQLGRALFVAAVAAGWVRVGTAFADATATALAPARELALLNALGGLFVPLAALGALAGAWLGGLAGVLYGTSLGWSGRALLAAWLARTHLRGGARRSAA